jgi:hypothetical protein
MPAACDQRADTPVRGTISLACIARASVQSCIEENNGARHRECRRAGKGNRSVEDRRAAEACGDCEGNCAADSGPSGCDNHNEVDNNCNDDAARDQARRTGETDEIDRSAVTF